MTREMTNLTFSYAITRYRYGKLKSCEPSRFLDDVANDYIKMTRSAYNKIELNINNTKSKYTTQPTRHNLQVPKFKPVKEHVPSPGFKPSDTSTLQKGMKVEHSKFGFGEVIEMDTEGANKKAKVKFDNFGEKTLLLTFAKLRICN